MTKRFVFILVVCGVAGGFWGETMGPAIFGVALALAFAAGAALIFALPCRRRFDPLRLFALPFLAFACLGFAMPYALVSAGHGYPGLSVKARSGGVIVISNGERDEDLVLRFVLGLRDEMEPMLGVLGHCNIDVYLVPVGAAGDFGHYSAPWLESRTIVHPQGAGWGSLAHHLMYAFSSCAGLPEYEFLRVGLATSVEKFEVDLDQPPGARWNFSHRHNWRAPPPLARMSPASAQRALIAAEPDTVRSFFVFMRETGRLTPFVLLLRAGSTTNEAMMKTLGPPSQMLQQWRRFNLRWQEVPVLEAAAVKG